MASKESIFLFACFLLVASKVAATKPACDDEMAPGTAPVSTPVYPSPEGPPPPPAMTYEPSLAPIYFTPDGPSSSPASAPTYFSTPPIIVPGVPSNHNHNHLGYCVLQCQQRCKMLRDGPKSIRKLRPCVHVCTACCAKNMPLCVPNRESTCPLWGSVTYHGGSRQCP